MDAGDHVVGPDQASGAADRAGGVDPQQGLVGRADGIGQVDLRRDDPLEGVRGLADDDGVDVRQRQLGIGQGPIDGLSQEAGDGHVVATLFEVGLSDPDDRAPLGHHSPSFVPAGKEK